MVKTEKNIAVQTLFEDVSAIIERGRHQLAAAANRKTVTMLWQIGRRINSDVLGNERAEYGKQIVSRLATQLSVEICRLQHWMLKNPICQDFRQIQNEEDENA